MTTPFSSEFDISVLSGEQIAWVTERAERNHHFDTLILDKINAEGAWLTLRYDDGINLCFFVSPDAHEIQFLGSFKDKQE